ncbi:MAG: cofactor-independent phosphoglycerate mutase [Oscillospiraceae bacterium]|nr:cofactor-independent phosphoglycerate mutase [Oscillospiraceae bacterium]
MKYILIIGDGMADFPVPELGNKTPLEYASIPTMDMMASRGEYGCVYNVPAGLPAGSDTAIMSIFGCDPRDCYRGRAPLEVAATGVKLRAGDAAYRCNMVCFEDGDMPFDEKHILSHSAGSIEGEESIEIITALLSDPEFKAAADKAGITIHKSPSFRHFAVQSNADIDGISLIPPHDHLGEKIGALMPSGCKNAKTLEALMRLAHEKLDHHPLNERRRAQGKMPANGIWFWAEGTAAELPNFVEQYGRRGGVVSAVPLCHGIAALIGLDMISVEGATGELDTNYEGKVDAALKVLEKDDFVAVHLEAPDECTHNGDLKGKLKAIENLDSRIIAPIAERLSAAGEDFRMLILSDHKTLTSTRGHDGSDVPYVIYDSRYDNKNGIGYSEKDCAFGGVPVAAGISLMGMLFGK